MSRFLDSSWYRVANLKPRLASHVEVQKHRYRGRSWYVLMDTHNARSHRLTPSAFKLILAMDGKQTMDQIWQQVVKHSGTDAPGQTAVIQLLGQLHSNDLLVCNIAPDSAELFTRFEKQSRSLFWKNLRNPLSIRIPLIDPDAFLQATLPLVRPWFSRFGFMLWLLWVVMGMLLAAQHWQEITENIADRVLSTDNLLMLWLAFPAVKILHELGHAYACRVLGGPVHEMGVMLLVGMLVPYVEASSSSGFHNKWHRFLVGAAGMMVELAVASLAMLLWTLLEPGALRSSLYNIMVIASVSTLVFNGNPLMRYDGYYMLSDWVEIPNLAARGSQYWYFLINRFGFGVLKPESFDASLGERWWFLLYTPLSYVYRLTVMLGIALYLAEKFLLIGAVIGLMYFYTLILTPLYKATVYVLTDPNLNATRQRTIWVSGGFIGILFIVIGLTPFPLRTQFEGVIWLPKQAQVRAGIPCFVRHVTMPSGSLVHPGELLVECEDPELMAQIKIYKARIEEINAQRMAEWRKDRNQAEITRQALVQAKADLKRAEQKAALLSIRSNSSGLFFIDRELDLPGRFMQQGDLVGFVVDRSRDIVRIVVPQNDIDLVRRNVDSIQVRLAENPDRVIPARLIREIPAADTELPSSALATEGGGQETLDPREQSHTKAMNRLFQFDLMLLQQSNDNQPDALILPYGTRAHVRFVHHAEPILYQFWRRIRQLFLSRLAI